MNDKNNEHKNVGMRDYAKCCEVSRLNSANDTLTVERQATAIAMSHNTELRLTHSNICLCVDALDRRHTIFFCCCLGCWANHLLRANETLATHARATTSKIDCVLFWIFFVAVLCVQLLLNSVSHYVHAVQCEAVRPLQTHPIFNSWNIHTHTVKHSILPSSHRNRLNRLQSMAALNTLINNWRSFVWIWLQWIEIATEMKWKW